MSQENVELVRRGVEALARNDWDAVLAGCDSGVEWVEMPSLGPDASTYIGIDEAREAAQSWFQMWDEYDLDVVRYVDADEDHVVLLARERGRGGASGATVERELGEVFTVRGRKVVRVRLYGSWTEALEAAGLRE